MKTGRTIWAAVPAVLLLALTGAQGAVLDDITMVAGPGDVFDPSGNETVDATPSGTFTSQAVMEARSDIRVMQDVRQGTKIFAAIDNTVYFTDPLMPDAFFDFTQNARAGSCGQQTPTSTLMSSAGESFRVIGGNNTSLATILVIEFGSYDPGTQVFTENTKYVQAAGFVMNNIRAGMSVTVEFMTDRGGTVLATQTVTGSDEDTGNGIDVYFGYASASYNIGAVVMSRTATDPAMSQVDCGIDDVGWTVIPEPATMALLGLGGALALLRRRRA